MLFSVSISGVIGQLVLQPAKKSKASDPTEANAKDNPVASGDRYAQIEEDPTYVGASPAHLTKMYWY